MYEDECTKCQEMEYMCEDCCSKVENTVKEIDLGPIYSMEVKSTINKDHFISAISEELEKSIGAYLRKVIGQELKSRLTRMSSYQTFREEEGKQRAAVSTHVSERIDALLREKFNEVYPDVVQNKLNAIAEEISNCKTLKLFPDGLDRFIKEKVDKLVFDIVEEKVKIKVDKAIDEQLKHLNSFMQEYFTNNLFKAMGMTSNTLHAAALGAAGKDVTK